MRISITSIPSKEQKMRNLRRLRQI